METSGPVQACNGIALPLFLSGVPTTTIGDNWSADSAQNFVTRTDIIQLVVLSLCVVLLEITFKVNHTTCHHHICDLH